MVGPVDMTIGREAQRIIRETPNLGKPKDSIHLASALRWNVEALVTYDGNDLLHLNQKLQCRDESNLSICTADEITDGELFSHARKKPEAR